MFETQTAFKEWAAVCAALGRGRQSLILRKGGIHEGRGGFEFKHPGFALFPTRFHEQAQHVRDGELPEDWPGALPEYAVGETVRVEFVAKLESVWTITDWEKIAALEPLHIWDEATVRERFEWAQSDGDPPALNAALARVSRLAQPLEFAYEKRHGGCRSWVDIPSGAAEGEPVLSDEAFAAERNSLIDRLGDPSTR